MAGAEAHEHELLTVENYTGQTPPPLLFGRAYYILLELFDGIGARSRDKRMPGRLNSITSRSKTASAISPAPWMEGSAVGRVRIRGVFGGGSCPDPCDR